MCEGVCEPVTPDGGFALSGLHEMIMSDETCRPDKRKRHPATTGRTTAANRY